jgi:hypothetical protein
MHQAVLPALIQWQSLPQGAKCGILEFWIPRIFQDTLELLKSFNKLLKLSKDAICVTTGLCADYVISFPVSLSHWLVITDIWASSYKPRLNLLNLVYIVKARVLWLLTQTVLKNIELSIFYEYLRKVLKLTISAREDTNVFISQEWFNWFSWNFQGIYIVRWALVTMKSLSQNFELFGFFESCSICRKRTLLVILVLHKFWLESGGALTVDRTLRDLSPIKISVFYIVQFDKGSPLKNGGFQDRPSPKIWIIGSWPL